MNEKINRRGGWAVSQAGLVVSVCVSVWCQTVSNPLKRNHFSKEKNWHWRWKEEVCKTKTKLKKKKRELKSRKLHSVNDDDQFFFSDNGFPFDPIPCSDSNFFVFFNKYTQPKPVLSHRCIIFLQNRSSYEWSSVVYFIIRMCTDREREKSFYLLLFYFLLYVC